MSEQAAISVEGSSPALKYTCPVCDARPGIYCKRPDGSKQIIAHKKRRELDAGSPDTSREQR